MNNTEESVGTQIVAFVSDLLKYWYLLVLSVMFTVGIAMVYVKFAAKKYNVNSSVVINVEKSGAYGGQSDNLSKVYQLIEQDKNLQNEIYYLQSSPLIRSVVEEMDLLVSYYLQVDKIPKEAEFSMKDLYGDAPFIIIPNIGHLQAANTYFYIRILSEERFVISAENPEAMIVDYKKDEIVQNSIYFNLSGEFEFGEEIGNSFSAFQVVLNSNYIAEAYLGKDLFFTFNTVSQLTNEFQSTLTVEASSMDATMVDMTLKSDNIQKGIDFLDGLIIEYKKNNLEKKNFLAVKTIEHLDFQLSDVSESLGSSEQELQNIRRSTSTLNIDEKASNTYTQLQALEQQKDEIARRKAYLVQMDEYFTSNKDSEGFMAPSIMGLDDPLLSGLIQELTTLISEQQQMINNNQLRNPRLRTLEISIGNIKEVISGNLKYSLTATNSELSEINGRIRVLNKEFASLPYTQRRMLGIERKFNLSEGVYMSLLEQKIQAQIIKSSTLSDCEIVEPPQFDSVQSPKAALLLIAALFFGCLIPILFILGKKIFTTKIMDKEEIKKLTNFTQIGSIPVNERSSVKVIVDQPNSITSEAIHSVRSNIIYYLMGKQNKVILVTSTMEGEGKSYNALNIASSFAVTNNKTCLLEFDLRRPSELYSRLGIRGLVGVSSYLINKASLEEITIHSDINNLDIILAGQIPPNPVELISSEATQLLFEELRKKYDYIIIDTPPYGVLTDSFVLMKYSDINIYVTRLRHVNKNLLKSSFEDMESKNISNVQILINGDNPKNGSYGKYYTAEKKGFGSKVFGRKKPLPRNKSERKDVHQK